MSIGHHGRLEYGSLVAFIILIMSLIKYYLLILVFINVFISYFSSVFLLPNMDGFIIVLGCTGFTVNTKCSLLSSKILMFVGWS